MKGGCKVYFWINRIVLVRESKKIIFKRELVGMSENIYFCDILQICEGMASLEILRKFLSNKGGNCWPFFSFLFFVLWFKTLLYFNHHQKKKEKSQKDAPLGNHAAGVTGNILVCEDFSGVRENVGHTIKWHCISGFSCSFQQLFKDMSFSNILS